MGTNLTVFLKRPFFEKDYNNLKITSTNLVAQLKQLKVNVIHAMVIESCVFEWL